MFVAFAKNEKNFLPKIFAKAITSSAQIGLACGYAVGLFQKNIAVEVQKFSTAIFILL